MRGIEEIILALDQTEEDVILNLAGNFLDKDYEPSYGSTARGRKLIITDT